MELQLVKSKKMKGNVIKKGTTNAILVYKIRSYGVRVEYSVNNQ